MNKLQRLGLLIILIALNELSIAQVGIGNPTPDSSAVLDLTNPNNKGLVLPQATNFSMLSNRVNGMTYFLGENIYYKTTLGYNALSPWKYRFNGNITNDVFYNLGGRISIGSTDITVRPEAPLQIDTNATLNLVDNGSLLIGKSTSDNLVLNATAFQTRNAGSAAPLKINENGGDVTLGSSATSVNLQVSGKIKEYNSSTNTYNDLIAAGTITMWYGNTSSIPVGWALCDGGTYQRSDGTGPIVSPNLSGRFIVASGNNGQTSYLPAATGGQDEVTLTTGQMPAHSHSINDPGHSHQFNSLHDINQTRVGGGNDFEGTDSKTIGNRSTVGGTTNITINNAGGGLPHENRPAFYSLVYMMKL